MNKETSIIKELQLNILPFNLSDLIKILYENRYLQLRPLS